MPEKSMCFLTANSVVWELLITSFSSSIFSLCFLSAWPTIMDKDTLKSPMQLQIWQYPCTSIFLNFVYFCNFRWCKFGIMISVRWIKYYQYVVIFFIPNNGFDEYIFCLVKKYSISNFCCLAYIFWICIFAFILLLYVLVAPF